MATIKKTKQPTLKKTSQPVLGGSRSVGVLAAPQPVLRASPQPVLGGGKSVGVLAPKPTISAPRAGVSSPSALGLRTSNNPVNATNNFTNNFGLPVDLGVNKTSNFTNNFGQPINYSAPINSTFTEPLLSGGSPFAGGTTNTPTTSIINTQTLGAGNTPMVVPNPKVEDYSMDIPAMQPITDQRADLEDERKKTFEDTMAGLLEDRNNKESATEIDSKLRKELGIQQKQQVVSDLQGKLNGIVSQGQANQLSLVGQGRGIPEAIIGGQQAQISRETAIQALPIQAQLSAAQGNLEMANDSLDRLFKIYSEEAQNEYEFKTEQRKMVYEFLTAEQKRKIEVLDKQDARKLQEKDAMIADAKFYAKMAFEIGQSQLGAQIGQLDPSSPTFKNDFAKLQAKIDPTQSAEFKLRVRAQNFQESMAIKSFNLASQAAEDNLKIETHKLTLEANKLFADTPEAKAVTVIKGQIATVDQLFINKVGTADRLMSDNNWGTLSKDNSVVSAIANAEVRARNPEINRLAEGGDFQAQASIADQVSQQIKKLGGGSEGAVSNMKNAMRFVDSAYQARVKEANVQLQHVKQIYPDSQVLTTYQENAGVSLKSQLDVAVKNGYKPEEIVEALSSDSIVGPKITEAIKAGWTPLQIFNYLQTQ